jgi:phosphatidylglycerophosphatase A
MNIKINNNKHHKHRFIDLIKLLKTTDGFISLGCGSGCITKAPGTFGTIFALITGVPFLNAFGLYDNMNYYLGILLLISFFIGLWAIQKTGERLSEHDSSHIVLDEIIAFWGVLYAIYYGNLYWHLNISLNNVLWLLAFGLFRFFDIVKPLGIKWCDQRFHNAFGVILDDLLAGIYSIIVFFAFFFCGFFNFIK